MRVLPFFSVALFVLFFYGKSEAQQHTVILCGERIPVEKAFVGQKLMDVIRKQIPLVNMASLRQRTQVYFPVVEAYLDKYGLPRDYKYLPIVESTYKILTSQVGARGFWQLMPATATQYGLRITEGMDERDDIHKSTPVACRLLLDYYKLLARSKKVYSWILTTAAYNFGIGNVFKAINNQGKDYFSMQLNPETAVYVYKFIAVKELFEYPELYMKNLGYNIFNTHITQKPGKLTDGGSDDDAVFKSLTLKTSKTQQKVDTLPADKIVYISAQLKGKYKNFSDGDLVTIQLNEDMTTKDGFKRKKSTIKGYGWMIDDRIYVDLGFGHEVTLYDVTMKKGVEISELESGKAHVILKNQVDNTGW